MQKEIYSNQLPDISLPKINDPHAQSPEQPKTKSEPFMPKEIDAKSTTQCYEEYSKLYFTNIILTNQVYPLSRLKHCSLKRTTRWLASKNMNRHADPKTLSLPPWLSGLKIEKR